MKQASFFGSDPYLSQGVGYAVVLGFGAIFAVATSYLVYCYFSFVTLNASESYLFPFVTFQIHLEKRFVHTRASSEWFNTAGRNVKTGLIASVIVSQWTWAATILQSSNVAWQVRHCNDEFFFS